MRRMIVSAALGTTLLAAMIVAVLVATRGENRATTPTRSEPASQTQCSSQIGLPDDAKLYRLCLVNPVLPDQPAPLPPGTPVHWQAATA
jgi:hypothetical protein